MTPPHRPPFEDFLRWADQAPCVPVYRQVTGDALTPVSAFRKVERSAPSFLFESVIGGGEGGRGCFLRTPPVLPFWGAGGGGGGPPPPPPPPGAPPPPPPPPPH